MLWLKAFHIIFLVTWFSGIFYLPRLYVYHSLSQDLISIERFKMMERKLLFWITTPAGVVTTILGFALLRKNWVWYLGQTWMKGKLLLVLLLWIYHFFCVKYYFDFKTDRNRHGHIFYRVLNELPVILLIGIVVFAVVKPF